MLHLVVERPVASSVTENRRDKNLPLLVMSGYAASRSGAY